MIRYDTIRYVFYFILDKIFLNAIIVCDRICNSTVFCQDAAEIS